MLETIRKRLHRAKFVFTIHLHHITPCFVRENAVLIAWKRGNKKNRRGQTQIRTPKKSENDNDSILNFDERFDLKVTLYSETGGTRETGPYYPKELEFKVMELEKEKSVRLTLGVVTIKLNEFTDLLEHPLKLPIKCEKSVTTPNGPPELHLTIRCWLKASSSEVSTLSVLSSVGQTQTEDQSENSNTSKCEKSDFQDPVRVLEDVENSEIAVEQSTENIVENTVKQEQEAEIESEAKETGKTNQEVPVILTQNEDNIITLSVDSNHNTVSKINQNSTQETEEMDAFIEVSSAKENEKSILQDQDPVLVGDLNKPLDSGSSQDNHSTEANMNLSKTQTQPSIRTPPGWLRWISWIPGSRLICCQTGVPKEP